MLTVLTLIAFALPVCMLVKHRHAVTSYLLDNTGRGADQAEEFFMRSN